MKSVRWGDLHAHCAASYGSGTPAHALAAARKHLDFCSITGHAFWPDLPMTLAAENAYIEKHLGAFQKLRRFWPELLQELAAATEPGRFVAFPSFEWHSCAFGDYNVYFKGPEPALVGGDSPEELCSALADTGMDFMRNQNGVPPELLDGLPRGHVAEAGNKAVELMMLGAGEEKNSDSPSLGPSSETTSPTATDALPTTRPGKKPSGRSRKSASTG